MEDKLTISVVVPAYMRTDGLKACLEGLAKQTRPAEQIVVTVRDIDLEVIRLLQTEYVGQCQMVLVRKAGLIHAQNMALRECTSDIVAFTDDDAVPRSDWLARIEQIFAGGNDIAGVGGRDHLLYDGADHITRKAVVGVLRPWGQPVGNHHCGVGSARDVHFLKGVNMAYRRDILTKVGFEENLRGSGAQLAGEMVLGLRLVRAGYRLIYDPNLVVDHYALPRVPEFDRNLSRTDATTVVDEVHNVTLAICEYLSPINFAIYVLYAVLVGSKTSFGIAQMFRYLPARKLNAIRLFRASMTGLILGIATHRRLQSQANRNSRG